MIRYVKLKICVYFNALGAEKQYTTIWFKGRTVSFQHFSVFLFDISCVIVIIFFTFLVLFHTIYCAIHPRRI
jgi:hypothetical protein